MNPNLASAFNKLRFNETPSNAKQRVAALFEYFHLAGYLSPVLITKAVNYLSQEHPFSVDNDVVIKDLLKALEDAGSPEKMDITIFLDEFAKQDYFKTEDIIDLIVFLQQTAFDRRFGEERDLLKGKPWMVAYAQKFMTAATQFDVVTEHTPKFKMYLGVGIMGAATFRVKTRLDYFKKLTIDYERAWALTGSRELSKGLDEEHEMKMIAEELDIPYKFKTKNTGNVSREYLDITETQMVNYFIELMCPGTKIGVVDSKEQSGHWRATTSQSAINIAEHIINGLMQDRDASSSSNNVYHFMIIAEQPYSKRMAMQVQRAFNKVIKEHDLDSQITVEGCGQGISEKVVENPSENVSMLARINSALGALMAECYNDARIQHPEIAVRSPDIMMFTKRDEYYQTLQATREVVPLTISLSC